MNIAFEYLTDADADHFVVCNNDQEFIEPGWDVIAKNKLYEMWPDGMGVVEIGNHADLSYNTFISRTRFWQEHYDGRLFNPGFTQYYADTDRVETLNRDGHLARLTPGLVNTHLCWDEVKIGGRKLWPTDYETFNKVSKR